ncbi:MAG: hypothetical protein COV55_02040 [Candidatus Komeilibacteria bacterium CG11_big_fil_rev_8_21_14_0_20_36_20]|uniref:Type IV pilus modification protein PilV n=1 Tax=Candidatus Komeilibacteria bacterium CG11_big_fil_rev_8_21_14_0_20_36_20 TaxID=1974477 RepID=A0A2H0NDC7_9BACT|nr:MAG: hypothetical protein COV55_02040 [Candidatus Komeilibacteria bacterium CG11_big_fil_rev_8_21_14_0_20_36_20]PIR81577.1 MAG: hypothetical protein COU21_02850 [Candidatus Komeilibacteria bacterium CG10_big_fil_rev_8_21_14_0_10_36_65]PJC55415.1 MAG: hypothetical protein CO027_02150 [Candidatus Komeilibacteria bacterium CG_4_9_14_0_2_um_filter_36_13]
MITDNQQSGFTIMELVIALGIFTVGIMGAFTLAISNLNVARDNFNRTLAGNLAREGVELVRNIRDSNWLKIDANAYCSGSPCSWDEYLINTNFDGNIDGFVTDYAQIWVPLSPLRKVVENCSDLNTCMANCGQSCLLYIDDGDYEEGYYSISPLGAPTNMYRLIQIKNICFDGVSEVVEDDLFCDAGFEKIGLQVTVRVGWTSADGLHYIDAVDYLYNWRR